VQRRLLRLAGPVLAAVAVLGFSGCFSWRYHTWDDLRIDAGGSTLARAYVAAQDASGDDVDIPFFLVGLGEGLSLGAAKWDLTGKFNGPVKMDKDNGLRDALLATGDCSDDGLDPSAFAGVAAWSAVHVGEEVDDEDAVKRLVESTLKIKAAPDAAADVVRVHFIVGGWVDDGDLVAEESDGYDCGGGTLTNLAIRGG
jgi:hypothetical protein